jgi:hypothetical protein
LTADLDDWSGLFLDGVWRRDKAGIGQGDRGLVFSAATLEKNSGDYFSLLDATVSPSDRESPNFSIRANRLWFLGGNDWAALNVLLYIGEVPVLWIPFFYYPSEEIVFHPVIGYRDREGRFVQTTTYLAGQKPPSKTGSTILKLAPDTGPTTARGLFLKRIAAPSGSQAKDAGAGDQGGERGQASVSTNTVKIMADIYDGLGGFAGLDATMPSLGPLSKFVLSSGLGVSRTLFPTLGPYTPFSAAGGWQSVWNKSDLLGSDLPLRYGFSVSAGLTLGPVNASFEFPLYSDPFFESDFRNRSEDMDWLNLTPPATTTSATTINERTSLAQKLSLSASFKPAALSPWLGSASLSRLSSSLSWRVKQDRDLALAESSTLYNYDPARDFFLPDTFRPLDAAIDLSGTLFEFPGSPGGGTATKKDQAAGTLSLRTPWDGDEKGNADSPETGGAPVFTPPQPAPDPPQAPIAAPFSAKLTWTLQPALYLERKLLGDAWSGAKDIDFSSLYDLGSWRLGGGLNSSFAVAGAALTGSAGLSYSDQAQARTVTANPLFASTTTALLQSDAKYAKRQILGNLRLSSQPFPAGSLLDASSLAWSLDSLLYNRIFSSINPDNSGNYKESFVGWSQDQNSVWSWSKDSITNNNVAATLSFRTGPRRQSVSLSATLPPTTQSLAASLGVDMGVWGYGLALGAQEKATWPDGGVLTWSAFSANLKATTPFGLTASDTGVYDFNNGYPVSNSASLSWAWASLSFQAQRTKAQFVDYNSATPGWKTSTVDSFLPTSLSLSLNPKYETPATELWRPSATLNLSYSQGLLRFTDSTIAAGLTAGMAIGSGFTLSFASQSQNRNAWRYWPSLFPAYNDNSLVKDTYPPINPLLDILSSLFAWIPSLTPDPQAFRNEYQKLFGQRFVGDFKLKSLSLTLSQDLEDWSIAVQASATPKLDTVNKVYLIDPRFSITIAWKDIPEMKTALIYQDSKLSW